MLILGRLPSATFILLTLGGLFMKIPLSRHIRICFLFQQKSRDGNQTGPIPAFIDFPENKKIQISTKTPQYCLRQWF